MLRAAFLASLMFLGLEALSLALVGYQAGVLPSLGLVACGMILGITLIKKSGADLSGLMRGRNADIKAVSVGTANSLALGVAGLLLLSPGFFSDILAAALLLPWPRRALGKWLERHAARFQTTGLNPQTPGIGPIIEGEAVEIGDKLQ